MALLELLEPEEAEELLEEPGGLREEVREEAAPPRGHGWGRR